jgi:hypothetical protein
MQGAVYGGLPHPLRLLSPLFIWPSNNFGNVVLDSKERGMKMARGGRCLPYLAKSRDGEDAVSAMLVHRDPLKILAITRRPRGSRANDLLRQQLAHVPLACSPLGDRSLSNVIPFNGTTVFSSHGMIGGPFAAGNDVLRL